jgi:hypothetical protein
METIHEQVQPFIPPDPEAAAAEEKPNTPGTAEPPASSSARTRAGSSATGAVHTHGHAGANARGPPPAYQSSVWSEDGQYISASDRLANFYRKFNKVLLDNIAIEKEKERLAHENAQLQDLIQQYLSGTKLTEDTLTSDNPLFVVNGRCVCIVTICLYYSVCMSVLTYDVLFSSLLCFYNYHLCFCQGESEFCPTGQADTEHQAGGGADPKYSCTTSGPDQGVVNWVCGFLYSGFVGFHFLGS